MSLYISMIMVKDINVFTKIKRIKVISIEMKKKSKGDD